MRNPSKFLDDLQILLKVFQLPHEVLIFDPKKLIPVNPFEEFQITENLGKNTLIQTEKKVLINLSNEKLEPEIFSAFEFILDFKSKPQVCENHHSESFYFINSPDGTIRWVFPKNLIYPGFLSLYNSSGLKATVFQQVVKLAYQTQTQHLICSGKFELYSKKEKYVQSLYAEKEESFSIFTGTTGPNRKAIIALHKGRETTHFIKFPLTEKSKILINNEWDHLRCLRQFQFENFEVPVATNLNGGIKLSNIKPDKFLHNSKLENTHFSAVTELYEQTTRFFEIGTVSSWKQSLDTIFSLFIKLEDSDLKESLKVRKIIGKMYEISQQINENTEIPIAYSHGDFTPWNMYLSRDRLGIYDWELASLHRPILFDLFHFIFQSHVLIKRSSFKTIADAVAAMRQHPSVRRLIGKYDIDFHLHYQLYLLINCSYYINLFIDQERLHKQVFWLIDIWEAAFHDLSVQKTRLLQSSRA